MRFLALCCLLLLTIVAVAGDDTMKEKYVSASLYSKWSETPLLLEAAEFIHRNNPNFLWSFIQEVADMPIFSDPSSINNQVYYNEVLRKSSEVLSNMQFDLLKLSLSIRTYSPTIEMSRKLAEEIDQTKSCLTFVHVHGQTSCDPSEISRLVNSADLSAKPLLFQFDKHYTAELPQQKSASKVVVVLYGPIGSAEFTKFHQSILALTDLEHSIDYVFRHNYNSSESDTNRVALSGYGVELDIKNLEYKNKDDAKVKQDDVNESQGTRESQDDSLNGFMLNKLKDLHPSLKENLDELKKHLLESALELAPLKPWQTQDLSLQAAQRILEADPNDALNVLEDLSQNFPVRARSLSKVQVTSELKKVLKARRSQLESLLGLEAGSGAMFLNGLQVAAESGDIFSLSALLRKEAKLMEGLHQSGLGLEQIKALVYLDTASKETQYGVDVRDSSVQWLNDLEKDKKYAQWPRNMQEILRPTYPGMTRSIARNFYNLVLVLNPAQLESQALLKVAESFYVNDVPLRIGFVLVTNGDRQTDGFKEADVALFRAHNYIKEKSRSNYKALAFLTDVYASAPKDGELSAELVVRQFKKAFPNEGRLEDVFGVDSDYDEGRLLSVDYFRKIGLRKLPQALLNGYCDAPDFFKLSSEWV